MYILRIIATRPQIKAKQVFIHRIGLKMTNFCIRTFSVGLIDANWRQHAPNDANRRQQAKMRQQRAKIRQQRAKMRQEKGPKDANIVFL